MIFRVKLACALPAGILLLSISGSASLQAQTVRVKTSTVELEQNNLIYPVIPVTSYLRDYSGQANLEDIRSRPEPDWSRSRNTWLSFPSGSDHLWVRFKVRVQESAEWLLVSEFPILDRLDLYVFEKGKLVARQEGGDSIPRSQLVFPHRFAVFPLNLKTNKNYDIFIRLRTNTTRTLSLKFMSRHRFYVQDSQEQTRYGILVAVALLIIVANLGLAIKNRSGLPLLYILMVLFYILFQIKIGGFLNDSFAFMEQDFNDRVVFLSGGFTVLAFAWLWRELLLIRIHAPRLDRLLLLYMLVFVGFMAVIAWPDPAPETVQFIDHALMLMTMLFFPLLLSSGCIALRKGFRPAIYSCGAGISQCIFMVVFLGVSFGAIQTNFSLLHILWVGYIIEGFLFFLSLSRRIEFQDDLRKQHQDLPANALLEIYQADIENPTGTEDPGVDDYVNGNVDRRYRKSKIARVDTEAKAEKLRRLMEDEKLYCDEDLSLDTLGEHLDLKPHQVSELLNRLFNKGFHRFVNEFRVQEAARLLKSDLSRTILSIALASGFNSKSSFNTEFKRITGTTPSSFRRTNTTIAGGERNEALQELSVQ